MIIVGMCLDSSKSYTTRFFKTRIMQFLGRISMSLYLSHPILINVIKLFIYGPVTLQTGEHNPYTMPAWAIPIHLVISLIFSTLLTCFIEEPAGKFLKNILANKGQIISEGNCGVLNFPKNQRNYCKDFCSSLQNGLNQKNNIIMLISDFI
jgi:peptidoglycan/LPS O-acetylase OafA/YrhL